MKALVKKKAEKGLWMEEVDKPTPKAGEVLIKVHKAAICGTDIHIYKWDRWAEKNVPIPTVVGHEFMGVVAELGSGVSSVQVGTRVSAEGHVTCGVCRSCREGLRHLCPETLGVGIHRSGCFAEYIVVPEENVFALPGKISDEVAAILDPLGNAVHTALSFDLAGEDVLVTGAGPIGAMSCAIARFGGARHVVVSDPNHYRLELSKKLGATRTVHIKEEKLKNVIQELGLDEGFTVGLEMSGNPDGFNSMLESMRPGGKIGLLGILPHNTLIDWDQVIFKMLHIKGIYGREIFGTWHKMTHMVEGGLNVDQVITHRFPFEKFEEAFETMLSRQSGKILLEW